MHRTVPTAENWLAASGSSARLEKRRVSAACGWVSPTKRAPLMSSFQPVSQNGTVSSLKAFSVLLILKCSSKIIFFRELIKPIWLQPPPTHFLYGTSLGGRGAHSGEHHPVPSWKRAKPMESYDLAWPWSGWPPLLILFSFQKNAVLWRWNMPKKIFGSGELKPLRILLPSCVHCRVVKRARRES